MAACADGSMMTVGCCHSHGYRVAALACEARTLSHHPISFCSRRLHLPHLIAMLSQGIARVTGS